MSDIKQTYDIAAPPADVWRALTDPRIIEEWSGAAAKFPVAVVAPYSLWNGDIRGRVLEMEPPRRLVQTWQPRDWTRTDSVVAFTLTPRGKGTRVDLVHVNVEASDYDGTSAGWDIYYLGAIKRMFDAKPATLRLRSGQTKAAKKAAAKKAKKPTKKIAAKKKTSSKKSKR
ncbi:MAG: SRPBCC domain-containing protein [Chloroflexota bacterium]|nr:SRPBCC domain-containing protein [Chloroflexota bacterium]